MEERIILAVDVSEEDRARHLIWLAKNSGARYVKMGLELSAAIGWRRCSELAAEAGIGWVADAKLDDIPNTVAQTVRNLCQYDHPPFAITMHTTSGRKSMEAAQEAAGRIKMLGVTILTSFGEEWEVDEMFYGAQLKKKEDRKVIQSSALVEAKVLQLASIAVESGLKGLVCSPREVGIVKSNPTTEGLFAMVPGSRSLGVSSHDQARKATPAETLRAGADLLVIGRQITEAADPSLAYDNLARELAEAGTHRS